MFCSCALFTKKINPVTNISSITNMDDEKKRVGMEEKITWTHVPHWSMLLGWITRQMVSTPDLKHIRNGKSESIRSYKIGQSKKQTFYISKTSFIRTGIVWEHCKSECASLCPNFIFMWFYVYVCEGAAATIEMFWKQLSWSGLKILYLFVVFVINFPSILQSHLPYSLQNQKLHNPFLLAENKQVENQ